MPGVSSSGLAALLAAAFACVVAERWRRSRRAAFAAWAVGLVVFAVAAVAQALGEVSGFSPASFRVFYLFGGILGVAYLALGTVHLMASPRAARAATAGLLLATVVAAIAIALTPVDASRLHDGPGFLGEALSGRSSIPIRSLAVLLNVAGTAVLAGGSARSAWRLWRERAGLDRVLCNVLLTAGALVIAAGLSAARVSSAAASLRTLGAYEAAGIAVMFVGFLALGRVGVGGRAPTPGSVRG